MSSRWFSQEGAWDVDKVMCHRKRLMFNVDVLWYELKLMQDTFLMRLKNYMVQWKMVWHYILLFFVRECDLSFGVKLLKVKMGLCSPNCHFKYSVCVIYSIIFTLNKIPDYFNYDVTSCKFREMTMTTELYGRITK